MIYKGGRVGLEGVFVFSYFFMNLLSKHEAKYISENGIRESVFSSHAYVPKEIHFENAKYSFYVNREERNVQVFMVVGELSEDALTRKNKTSY